MTTPAAWNSFIALQETSTLRSMVLRFRRPVVAVVLGASLACGTGWVTELATRQGWLHIMVELIVASLAMAASALAAIVTLNRNHRQFVETMAKAMDARDAYTAGHSSRVAEYAYATARALGFSKRSARTIREAAELHDIGKIGVPDAVLQKRGPLTLDEIGLIRLHPVIGKKILERTGHFKKLLPIVELHHENWDGSGYPYGLRGEETPLEARIARVADAFDAMTSARCYRATPTVDWAVEEMRRCSGTHFDPRVAGVFLTLLQHGVFKETLQSAAGQSWATGSSAWDAADSELAPEIAVEAASGRGRSLRQRA